MVIIETERLLLRLLTKNDQQMILTLLNEPSFIKNIGDKNVRNLADAWLYISNGPLAMQNSLGFSLYCCELKHSGEPIGISGLIKREGVLHPEIGFAFLDAFCGKGYGFESASAVVKYASKVLHLNKLQAICNPDNHASSNLLTKLGFEFKKQILLDVNVEQVSLYEFNNPI